MKRNPALTLGIILISFFCLACQTDSGADQVSSPVSPVAVKQGSFQVLPETSTELAGNSLQVMLARTFDEKALGLMYYETLPENSGMLFIYQAPRQMSFWMKNTMIPLDLIFFSPDLEITEWIENMEPGFGKPEYSLPRYQSTMPAQYALELNAGMVKKLNLKQGDKLDIPITLLYSD